jgi:hypothetical protein
MNLLRSVQGLLSNILARGYISEEENKTRKLVSFMLSMKEKKNALLLRICSLLSTVVCIRAVSGQSWMQCRVHSFVRKLSKNGECYVVEVKLYKD